jgi:hypothetical protein
VHRRRHLTIFPSYDTSGWSVQKYGIRYTIPQFTVTGIQGQSSVSHVGAGALHGLHIVVLTLFQLSIASIDDNAFADIGGTLKTLNMSDNAIETISPGVFNGLSNLQVLDLSRNQLLTLNSSQFQQLTALTALYLGALQTC